MRDSMHFSSSDGNHAALSLMIFDEVRWTCMASIMMWKKITAWDAPKLYHGTQFCNASFILENGLLPGKATSSGRSDIFFSAILTTSAKRMAWSNNYYDTGYDSYDYVKTTLGGYRFDSEVAVVVDTMVAIMGACEFYMSESTAILCKQPIPKVAITKLRWSTMNTVIWRCGEVTKVKEAPMRVVLKENPRPPLKHGEASTTSASSSQTIKSKLWPPLKLEEAPQPSVSPTQPMKVVLMERDESPAKVVLKYREESSSNLKLKERVASLAAS